MLQAGRSSYTSRLTVILLFLSLSHISPIISPSVTRSSALGHILPSVDLDCLRFCEQLTQNEKSAIIYSPSKFMLLFFHFKRNRFFEESSSSKMDPRYDLCTRFLKLCVSRRHSLKISILKSCVLKRIVIRCNN